MTREITKLQNKLKIQERIIENQKNEISKLIMENSKEIDSRMRLQKKLDKVFKAHENSKLLKHEVMSSNVYSSASRLDPHKNGPYLS